jgi:hypothetical protein
MKLVSAQNLLEHKDTKNYISHKAKYMPKNGKKKGHPDGWPFFNMLKSF